MTLFVTFLSVSFAVVVVAAEWHTVRIAARVGNRDGAQDMFAYILQKRRDSTSPLSILCSSLSKTYVLCAIMCAIAAFKQMLLR